LHFVFGSPRKSGEEFDSWFLSACKSRSDSIYYAVVDKTSGLLVGYQSLIKLEPVCDNTYDLVIHWGPRLAGSRGATEALYLFATLVFHTLSGYTRLGWRGNNQNERSKKAARRFGFTFEGVSRVPRAMYNCYCYEAAYYSMLHDVEWPLVKRAMELWLQPDNFDGCGMQRRKLRTSVGHSTGALSTWVCPTMSP